MSIGSQAFAKKQFIEINGCRMAYIDEGTGDPIVFQHGNPASSYLWRNIMPACMGLGRLIACDLIGMGDSDKLTDSGPRRYTFEEQRSFLFALWEELGITKNVVLVLHDWGSVIGFDWANQHRNAVQGIAYMEAVVRPLEWRDYPPEAIPFFKAVRSELGEEMILARNTFVDQLPSHVQRKLSESELAEYQRPFAEPGEGRRPILSLLRDFPIDGEPAPVAEVITEYGAWLATSDVAKLAIRSEPGALDTGRSREFSQCWPNQTEVTVQGLHFVQEDSPVEIGTALASFVRRLRGSRPVTR